MKPKFGSQVASAMSLALCLQTAHAATSYSVYVSYAENERAPRYFPDPWLGSPKTTFLGYPGPAWDTGGILILNTGTTSITLSPGAKVDGFRDGSSYQLWDGMIPTTGLVITPGTQVILAQTGALPSRSTSPPYSSAPCVRSATALCWSNFDTSDTPLNKPRNAAQPQIHLTIDGIAKTFTDTAQVLNTGGFDYGDDLSLNESLQWRPIGTTGATLPAGTGVPAIVTPFDVVTYHDDAERTGLNNIESVLTSSRVASGAFRKLNTVSFSGHPDAQPLVVSAQTWGAWGYAAQYPHDVVYVATESNDLFAIDGVTGKILLQRNFGTPVAQANLPADCGNNPATVGINSTPVIDLVSKAMYLISYGEESNGPAFRVHKINLVDLSDNLPSVVVAGSGRLSDGSTINFAAAYQRQRPGLLLTNGNLYAGFGSFCDQASNHSRGWVLGWNASNLGALPAALMEQQTTAQIGGGLPTTDVGVVDFLSSIWQSGYGLAADSSGYIYAQTGNSSGRIANNYPDSVVKLPTKLGTVSDSFTPSDFAALDAADQDRGSAGVMVVPDQPNGLHFAVAPGKDGRMFLLNRQALGGYVANGRDVPPHVATAGCWCGPDYYVSSDGRARVALSSGNQVQTWTLPTTATGNLTADASAVQIPAGTGDPGFMSAVSSYGSLADSSVIWGVSRAINGRVYLQAVDGTSGAGGGSPALNGINTSVTDKVGRVWSFGTSTRNPGEHSLLVNGAATTGWGVKLVIGNDGLAYNLNSAGQWYTGDGTHWTQQQAPPAARLPSQAGTTLTPASGTAITDSAGNVWAFGPSARNPGEYNLVRNGLPMAGSFAVKLVIGSDGNLYRHNYYGHWYAANGLSWTALTAPPPTYLPSRIGAIIYPAYGGSLTDAGGNAWSFGSTKRNPGEYNLVRNGVPTTGGFAVKLVMGSDGNVYNYNYYGKWSTGNGTTWTQLSTAPNAFAPVYGSYVTPAAAGELRELQLVDTGAWEGGRSNANIVPVVANGRVYVATTNALTIWGVE